jgi:dolichol-phosphate mannosyltransferase
MGCEIMVEIKIVVPTWNERENIERLLNNIRKVMSSLKTDYEVIIVDDNSPDGTAEIATKFNELYGHVKVIRRYSKAGLGSAIKDGLKYALGDANTLYIVTMDADMSHLPEEIPNLLDNASTVDIVQGSRYVKGGKIVECELYRRVISRVANVVIRLLFHTKIKDHTSGFRVYTSKAAIVVVNGTFSGGYEWLVEALLVAIKRGLAIKEVPITFINRRKGKSKLWSREILRWFIFMLHYAFRSRWRG